MSFFCSTIQFSICFKWFSATPESGVHAVHLTDNQIV
ncbi:hypothetical protein SBC1_72920 (plasmid) [Caballeronia sp. SBC1]|nr:hypothetical protein SBC2_73970 [Caballeronia sp. SBC2]QIN67245.1 hypothetical protein SBC1_72920 [Caballeronia sp. SBC1]